MKIKIITLFVFTLLIILLSCSNEPICNKIDNDQRWDNSKGGWVSTASDSVNSDYVTQNVKER